MAVVITLGVLVSGSGSNLQAILDAVAAKTLDARVAVVVSNVAGAGALERARKAGVEAVVIDHKAHADRRAFDAAVVEELRGRGVELVVLAGFMR
ncbi:MAG TPA: formyltransferase family protein, partial [Byssovorax sp.]